MALPLYPPRKNVAWQHFNEGNSADRVMVDDED